MFMLLDCLYCTGRVRLTDQWEDDDGILHADIHISCGIQFITRKGLGSRAGIQ